MPVIETKGAASSGGFGQFARQVAANYIEDVFSTYLYTGNGTTQTITNGIDLSTKGGLVWMKGRSGATEHALYDTLRGATKELNIWPYQEFTQSGLTAFNTNGFNLGSHTYVNASSATYSSWTFRKQEKFFDVVTYTGNGTAGRTVAHNLGSVPGCIFIKCRDVTNNQWVVYHRSLGATQALYLSAINVAITSAQFFNNASPTATTFTLGSGGDNMVNASGATYVAYIFAHDAGGFGTSGTSNVISCGSYVGNGSSTGPNVTLGYEPQWLLIKNPSSYEDWTIVDTSRGLPVNGTAQLLFANVANSESPNNPFINVSATGFQPVVSSSRVNTNGATYIYMAIRRGPMRTPTSGTSVFGMQTYSDGSLGSAAPIVLGSSVGFPVDTAIAAIRTSGAANITKYVGDRLRGRPELKTPAVDAESNTDIVSWAWQAGVQVSTAGNWYYFDGSAGSRTFAAYFFRRAPGFFDVVCYTGTGANLTITHNLGAVPQMMWVKTRTGVFLWGVYDSFNGATKFMRLNGTNGSSAAANYFNNTSPTSSVFTVGTALSTVSENYVAYLFGSVSGVSKFGNYTGTGTTQQIDCGFTGGARFVLIKRTDTNGDWYVWDTARGIVAGNDPYLLLNSTTAEVTGTDYIDTLSSGFEISSTAPTAINGSGGTFIYLAIA